LTNLHVQKKYEHENNDLTAKTIRQEEEISKLTSSLSHIKQLAKHFMKGVIAIYESEKASHASFRDRLGEATAMLRHDDHDGDFGIDNLQDLQDHESSAHYTPPNKHATQHSTSRGRESKSVYI
jgi:hypothetical protein